MEKAKAFLELTQGESDRVSSLAFPPHRLGSECSFYEYYALRGIRVDRIEPGQVFCTFEVPPRLTDELEIIGRVLGQKGGYSGTSVLVKNKITGELIAEGRHSLFGKHASKM